MSRLRSKFTRNLVIVLLCVIGVLLAVNKILMIQNTNYIRAYAEQLIKANPNDANGWINLCAAYIDQGVYDRALEACNHALQIDATSADALQNRGVVYEALSQPSKALDDYKAAFEIAEKYDWKKIRRFRYNLLYDNIQQLSH